MYSCHWDIPQSAALPQSQLYWESHTTVPHTRSLLLASATPGATSRMELGRSGTGGLTNREVGQIFKQVAPRFPILTAGGKLAIRVALNDIIVRIKVECKVKAKLADAKKAVSNVLKARGLKDGPATIILHADREGQKAVKKMLDSKAKSGGIVSLSECAGLTVSTDMVAAWNRSIVAEVSWFSTKFPCPVHPIADVPRFDLMQANVYITAVLEYLCVELCELTANCADQEYPSKLKLHPEMGVIDSDDEHAEEEDEDSWQVQDIYLAEAHHVLKAIFNEEEMSKAFPNHGAYFQRVHWSAFQTPQDEGKDIEHDDDDDEDEEDEPVSSKKKAGKAKAKAGASKGITKPKKAAKGKGT